MTARASYEVAVVQAGGNRDGTILPATLAEPGDSIDVHDERPRTFLRLVMGEQGRLVLVGYMENATEAQRRAANETAVKIATAVPGDPFRSLYNRVQFLREQRGKTERNK